MRSHGRVGGSLPRSILHVYKPAKAHPSLKLLSLSLSCFLGVDPSLPSSSEESQEQIDKERGSPESFTPGSQPPSSRFLDAAPDVTLSRASRIRLRSRKLRQSRYQDQRKTRRRSLDFLLFRSRILRPRDTSVRIKSQA